MGNRDRYAVLVGNEWRIAVQVSAADYGPKESVAYPERLVWADAETAGWLCLVGEEVQSVNLTAPAPADEKHEAMVRAARAALAEATRSIRKLKGMAEADVKDDGPDNGLQIVMGVCDALDEAIRSIDPAAIIASLTESEEHFDAAFPRPRVKPYVGQIIAECDCPHPDKCTSAEECLAAKKEI